MNNEKLLAILEQAAKEAHHINDIGAEGVIYALQGAIMSKNTESLLLHIKPHTIASIEAIKRLN